MTDSPDETLAAIADLWRDAVSRPLHGPLCRCVAGAVVPTPASVEADLLDYLQPRYREDAPELAALIARRQAAPQGGFIVWLRSAAIGELPASARQRLFEDIRATLESLAEASRGSAFACA